MRYSRNGILTDEDQARLIEAKICIVGCGGLGGYLIEMLTRIGIGNLTLVDGDEFAESNLNRQLLSLERNLGKSKVYAGRKRALEINSGINVRIYEHFIDTNNVISIVKDHDLVLDALDSVSARFILQSACRECGVKLIHGAISGWYGQISTIFPGDDTLDALYGENISIGIEEEIGNPSFSPATIASIQVSEAIKILIGKPEILRNKVMTVDLLNNDMQVVKIK